MKQNYVNQGVRKKDSMALVTGKPVYTGDLAPKDCLTVRILRSPHAHAWIDQIDTSLAGKVPGVACILTYEDVPEERFTMAGQTYPEPSPYDRLILDRRVRYVGDAVAVVAAETPEAAEKALKLIRVQYQVLPAVLDFHTAKDHPVRVHPEENWKSLVPVGADPTRNLCASGCQEQGDVEAVFASCEVVLDRTYHTRANQQAMMETFRSYSYMDTYGRLNVVASTQVTFHVRRILSNALGIPKSRIRVIKPRIGGGFGAKQTVITEVYPALVTLKTGRSAMCVYTREESQTASSPRHEMEIRVKLGADRSGKIRAVDLYTLSNTGAYGEHGPTTVGLSGHKSIPIYSGSVEAFRFHYDVVYTNQMSAGAYRGYGATQGFFAMESAVSELAHQLGIDPAVIREKNMVRQGQRMPAYYDEVAASCTLDQCLKRVKEMIGWEEKYPRRVISSGKVRGVGLALAMQGSGISGVDTASVSIKVNDDGFYSLMFGASDMGTGCDTILAQMAADCLDCNVDEIVVSGVDTDVSPYDSGSYASSTTYVTGMAVVKTCETLRRKIVQHGARILGCEEALAEFDGTRVRCMEDGRSVTLKEIANSAMCANNDALSASESHYSSISPPPFMAGAAEVEVDLETGQIELVDYCAVVDCGTVINPNLARVQTEGGLVQGIGMTLYENIQYDSRGRMLNQSFLQYKIPTRMDVCSPRVEFAPSYEESGPFGAKSIGEVVINTPAPAIAEAIYNATGLRFYELPITAEKIAMGLAAKS